MRCLVAAVLALGLLASACGGPASAPDSNDVASSGTSAPSLTPGNIFRSRLYPYSLVLPEGWGVLSSGPDEDFFESSDQLSSLTVGTGIPDPGQTVEDRVRQNRTQFAGCQSDQDEDRPIQIDGEPGIRWIIRCEGRYSVAANTIHDGIGYRLRLEVPAAAEAEAHLTMDWLIAHFAFTE